MTNEDAQQNQQEMLWIRQRHKRCCAIHRVRETDVYKECQAAGVELPREPNPDDRFTSKRAWETSVATWRQQLRQARRHLLSADILYWASTVGSSGQTTGYLMAVWSFLFFACRETASELVCGTESLWKSMCGAGPGDLGCPGGRLRRGIFGKPDRNKCPARLPSVTCLGQSEGVLSEAGEDLAVTADTAWQPDSAAARRTLTGDTDLFVDVDRRQVEHTEQGQQAQHAEQGHQAQHTERGQRAQHTEQGQQAKHTVKDQQAKSLPVVSQRPCIEITERRHVTVPLTRNMERRELQIHFGALKQLATQHIYKTRISPESLHMKLNDRDGVAYIALLFKHEFTPMIPVQRPHVTLAYECVTADWASWWRLRTEMMCFMTERQITCHFNNRRGNEFSYVLSEDSELGVLCRRLQEIIAAAHPLNCPTPLRLAGELHITFCMVGEHTA